jgi:hypothetical protein
VREGGGARVSTEITRAMEKGRMELGGSMVPRRERKKGGEGLVLGHVSVQGGSGTVASNAAVMEEAGNS